MSFGRGLGKEDAVHRHHGALLSVSTDETLPFETTRMDLESIVLSEISATEKDKKHRISLTCGM